MLTTAAATINTMKIKQKPIDQILNDIADHYMAGEEPHLRMATRSGVFAGLLDILALRFENVDAYLRDKHARLQKNSEQD